MQFARPKPLTLSRSLPPRRALLGIAALGVLASGAARAQMSGGMGGRGGPSDGAKCGAPAAEPVSTTLVKINARERLRSMPAELKLAPDLMPLYERYVQAVQKLMLDEGKWRARPVPDGHPLASIGAQIDFACYRVARWEDVLDAVKPLYARLDKSQQAIADKRLVVSLEPAAWALRPRPNAGAPSGPPAGAPSDLPAAR